MKMMSEVPAPADCIIEEVLVKDGELVGFDAPHVPHPGGLRLCSGGF